VHDDVEAAADMLRPFYALYFGGMGAKSANFHNNVPRRMGYEAEAEKVQDLYLAARKDEAAAALPTRLIEELALIGPVEKIREISQNVEAQIIKVPTGCQDYYPAMYGGVSAIELTEAGIVRKALPVDLDDLNERIVLAYTGEPRNSGINNWEVMKAHIDGSAKVFRNFERIAEIAYSMRAALEKADWDEVARLLREEWSFRRKNAPGITTPLIDKLVSATRRSGAVGAKVCGAGGGGCVIFLAERGAKERVAAAIEREGAQVLPVRVAPRGVQVKTEK
jgi:D-glycero-alpha-D-manno-heptose-7-phosphate kinase